MVAYRCHDEGEPRLGLAVAKRFVRRAHERNRIKRLVRERFRQLRRQMPGVDMVLLVKAGVEHLDNEGLNAQIDQLMRKVAARCDESSSS